MDLRPNVNTGHTIHRNNQANPRSIRDIISDGQAAAITQEFILENLDKKLHTHTGFGTSFKDVSQLGQLINSPKEAPQGKKANKGYDMDAVESWIDKTLREAEYFKIPNTIKRSSKATEDIRDTRDGKISCAIDYGIDRITLQETGITNEGIDSLYR